jgi:hypothetical protein
MSRLFYTQIALTILLISSSCSQDRPPEPPSSAVKSDDSQRTFLREPANVGDNDMRAKAKACVAKGKFFDRTAQPPDCTALYLANIDCRESGIKELMDDENDTKLDNLLGTTFSGFQLDQCLSCTEKTKDQKCLGKDGKPRIGVRVWFVKDTADQLISNSFFLPTTRPVGP